MIRFEIKVSAICHASGCDKSELDQALKNYVVWQQYVIHRFLLLSGPYRQVFPLMSWCPLYSPTGSQEAKLMSH